MKVTAIVPAAGAGLRFKIKKGQRKPFFILIGKPILAHTLLALEGSGRIDDIIVVIHRYDIPACLDMIRRFRLNRVKAVVQGGQTRFDSVNNGLKFVSGDTDIVLIHDGVRPLVNRKIITDSVRVCVAFGAAVAGVPVTSTIKLVGSGKIVKKTPDRKMLYAAQTPQVFKKSIIIEAYARRPRDASSVTDSSMLVERLGRRIKIVPGSYDNIKITTPADAAMAASLLKRRGRHS